MSAVAKKVSVRLVLMVLWLCMPFLILAQTNPDLSGLEFNMLNFMEGSSAIILVIGFFVMISAFVSFAKGNPTTCVIKLIISMIILTMPTGIHKLASSFKQPKVEVSTPAVSEKNSVDSHENSSGPFWILAIFPIIIGGIFLKEMRQRQRDYLNRQSAGYFQEGIQDVTLETNQHPHPPPSVVPSSEAEDLKPCPDIKPGKRKVILD